jgi:dihydropyrimidinase
LIQHLLLDATEYENKSWNHAAQRVMSPPFRAKVHQDSLWAGLQSGSLQVVATDHCAFTSEQKRTGIDDFRKIPNGTGGLEEPLLWTAGVNTGRLTREEFVAVTSANIARILTSIHERGGSRPARTPTSWCGIRLQPKPLPRKARSAGSTTMCSRVLPALAHQW